MRAGIAIYSLLGGEDPCRVSYTVTEGGGGYFRNVKKLAEYSPSAVVLRGKKGGVRVEGEALELGKCESGDVVVRGKIVRVEGLA